MVSVGITEFCCTCIKIQNIIHLSDGSDFCPKHARPYLVAYKYKFNLNVKIPFYQQMHLLLSIQNVKIYIKISYIRFYMFRSIWTILRKLTPSLVKVTLLWK